MIGKRRLLAFAAGLLLARQASAATYPSEPIKLIVPRAPSP